MAVLPKALLLLILVQICILGVATFNLDLLHPVVYHSNQNNDYFGFSLALHPGGTSQQDVPWMMVGAPKTNDTYRQAVVSNVGVVYKCLFKGKCSKLKVDYAAVNPRGEYQVEKKNSMLGSSMDMSSDRFVVCSPKLKHTLRSDNKNYRMYGACYWGMSSMADYEVDSVVPLAPTGNAATDIFQVGRVGYPNFMWGQAGFSTHLFNNSKGQHEMLLGAPSVRNWVGSTVTYRDGSDYAGGLARRRKRAPSNAFSEGPNVPDSSGTRDIEKYGLLGYSVTAGKYFSRTELVSVAGAPSTAPGGKVFAYVTSGQGSYASFEMRDILSGMQFGEYFGESLASGDINGDGLDDLVIGSPQYTVVKEGIATQNEGRVFVYLGSFQRKFALPKVNHEIRGQAYNGRLGTTVACLGDLDLDGFHDFAISAPYVGTGIVYIYKGSQEGLQLSQRIIGSEIFPNMAGFGFSISRGQDLDKNGYKDIAIGAYKTGHAVIIRSKPVIDLSASIVILGEKLREDAKVLDTEICVQYTGQYAPENIKAVMILTMDPGYFRIYRPKSPALTTTRDIFDVNSRGFCGNVKFNLKDNIRNFIQPIQIIGEFFLAPENVTKSQPILVDGSNTISGYDGFCPNCPLLRGSNLVKTAEVGFFLGCRNENNCIANLGLEMSFIDSNSANIPSFVIGLFDTVALKVTLTNTGDPAFNTKLYLKVPSEPTSIPTNCQDVTNGTKIVIECDAGNPIKANTKRDFQFRFDALTSAGISHIIKIDASLKTVTPLENPGTASASISLPLISQADVTVYGSPKEKDYRFELDVEDKRASKVSPIISYQVEKAGVSPLQEVVVKVDIPVALKDGRQFLHLSAPKFYMDSRPLICEHNDYQLASNADSSPGQVFSQEESLAGATSSSTSGGSSSSSSASSSSSSGVRAKRQVQIPEPTDFSKYPANRTMFINCTQSDWQCTRLVCRTDLPFPRQVANLELKLNLDMSVLENKLGQNDIIILGTTAYVEIVKPAVVEQPVTQYPDMAQVSVVLLRRVPSGKVATWVIALSVIGGILLLLLLATGLLKAGFFQRKQRDELLLKKRQTEMATASAVVAQQGEENSGLEYEIPISKE